MLRDDVAFPCAKVNDLELSGSTKNEILREIQDPLSYPSIMKKLT